jgi:predicted ATPase
MVEETGDLSQMPELLRVKASLLLTMQTPDLVEAESCLTQSLEVSRRQGARAWELRTATEPAALTADRGERGGARAILQPVFAQFTEGFDTVDLKAAERLLANLE